MGQYTVRHQCDDEHTSYSDDISVEKDTYTNYICNGDEEDGYEVCEG